MPSDISRRDHLLGLGCCCAGLAVPFAGNATEELFDLGCGINATALEGLDTARRLMSLDLIKERLRSTSGIEVLDQTLGFVLVELAHDFGVYPAFYFFADAEGGDARATRAKLDEKSDGTVLFGTNLLTKSLDVEGGDAGILAICAHEFAHIAAFKRADEVKDLFRRAPRYAGELHADYLSGYFMAKYTQKNPGVSLAAAGSIWMGMGSQDPNRPGSHGTIEMRRKAINAGFNLAQTSSGITFPTAFTHASRYIAEETL